MGSSCNDFAETLLTDHFTEGHLELALCSSTPGPASVGVELSGDGYARAAVTFGSPDNNQVTNSVEIEFPAATDDWDTIVGWVLFNSDTDDPVLYGVFAVPVEVVDGYSLTIPVGAFIVQVE